VCANEVGEQTLQNVARRACAGICARPIILPSEGLPRQYPGAHALTSRRISVCFDVHSVHAPCVKIPISDPAPARRVAAPAARRPALRASTGPWHIGTLVHWLIGSLPCHLPLVRCALLVVSCHLAHCRVTSSNPTPPAAHQYRAETDVTWEKASNPQVTYPAGAHKYRAETDVNEVTDSNVFSQ
jgi:hypothetical protein